MALKDLDTFFDPDLHLPIKGKTYRIPAPDGVEGPRLRSVVTTEGMPATEQTDEALKVLGASPEYETETVTDPETGETTEHQVPTGRWSGGAFEEMAADGVPWPMILHAGRTALLHFGFSPDMGEIHWAMAHLGRLVDLETVSDLLATPTT